jgi:phospholipid/cholesterol/gamma-HCH transport system ATP-binding protein
VYDNIVFGLVRHGKRPPRKELDRKVSTLLSEVELPGLEARMPSELSGGMQKRVGLARALAMEPATVFYDEPTSGLDPVTAYTIDDLIVSTSRRTGVTSVVVSHQLSSIFRISDHVAMLHEGEIVVRATPAELQGSDNPIVQAFIHPEREHGSGAASR